MMLAVVLCLWAALSVFVACVLWLLHYAMSVSNQWDDLTVDRWSRREEP